MKSNQQAPSVTHVFNQQKQFFVLPRDVCFLGVGVSLVVIFFLAWPLGIAFAFCYFKLMNALYKTDPKALSVWLHYLQRGASGYCATNIKNTQIMIQRGRR